MKKERSSRFPRLSDLFAPRPGIDFEREWRKLVRLQEINQWLNSELDPKRLLDLIMDIVIDLTRAERGFLILDRNGTHDIVVARNIDREEVRRPSFKISHSIAERVHQTGKPVITEDALNEVELSAFSSVSDLKLKSVLCVPFRIKDRMIGTLYLDPRFEKGKFTDDDLKILEAFSNQAAIALENSRLLEEVRSARDALEQLNAELAGKLRAREEEIEALRREGDLEDESFRHDYRGVLGRSPAMRRVLRLLDRVIDTELPVILSGESGTGKELFARLIHENGPRKRGPFVSLNCGAIPAPLLESELFGHVRGAFTGAVRDKLGLFEAAHRGTLLLDEVAEMESLMQTKLLRALENGEIQPVGASSSRRVDVRIVSATNRDLEGAVASGSFREDLNYRLKGFVVEIPPLRERTGDIPLLVDAFLDRIASETGAPRKTIRPQALRLLERHRWPGNVRELQNAVRRLVALSEVDIDEGLVHREYLSHAEAGAPGSPYLGKTLSQIERGAIVTALEANAWRKAEAARQLGISRRTLYDKMKRHRIAMTIPESPDDPRERAKSAR